MTRAALRARILAVPLVAALVAVPTLAQTATAQSWMAKVGLVATPTGFTDLSIAEYAHLYSTVAVDGTTTFSFDAHNDSAKPKTYRWVAAVQGGGRSTTERRGSLTVQGGQTVRVPVTFRIADCSLRNEVSVTLDGPDARSPQVHFWVLPRSSQAWKTSGGPGCGS